MRRAPSAPALAGEGDRPKGGGGGAGSNVISIMQGRVPTASSTSHFVLRLNQACLHSLFCNDNEAPRPAPPPPRCAIADASRRRSLRKVRRPKAAFAPSPASRGRISALVLATQCARGLPTEATKLLPPKKQGEAERRKGATVPWGLATQRMSPSICASGGAARSAERARLSAHHRGACSGHVPKLSPGRASRDAVRRRYPHLGIALKRGTSRAGRNAGGVDARTARERK